MKAGGEDRKFHKSFMDGLMKTPQITKGVQYCVKDATPPEGTSMLSIRLKARVESSNGAFNIDGVSVEQTNVKDSAVLDCIKSAYHNVTIPQSDVPPDRRRRMEFQLAIPYPR